jgi:hypothetical protein
VSICVPFTSVVGVVGRHHRTLRRFPGELGDVTGKRSGGISTLLVHKNGHKLRSGGLNNP